MVGLALYTIRHLTAAGLPVGWDTLGHWAKVVFLKQELWPNGWWDGFFPYWHGGFQLFQFYPPLFYYLVGWTGDVTGLANAFKGWTALSYLLLPVSVYVWAIAFGLGRMAAFGGALASLFIDTTYGAGITGTFAIGLVPNALGLALFPLCLSAYHKAHRQPRWMWLSGTAFGILLVGHTFSAYYTGLALALYSLFHLRTATKRTLLVGAVTLAVGVGLASFWLVPTLVRYGDHGLIGAWVTSDWGAMLLHLVTGKTVGDFAITLLGGLGLWVALGRGRTGGYLAALWLLTCGLALGLGRGWLPFGDVVGSSQFLRFQAFLGLVTALMAGMTLQRLWEMRWLGIGALAAAFLAIALFSWPALQRRAGTYVHVTSDFGHRKHVDESADWLKAHLLPGERVLGEFSWDATWLFGTPHVASQALALAQVEDLAGNFPEGSPLATGTLAYNQNLGWPEIGSKLAPYGVRYVLAITEKSIAALAKNADFDHAYTDGPVQIFRLKSTQLVTSDRPVVVQGVRAFPQGCEYRLSAGSPTQLRLPIGYLSTWRLTINGQPSPFREDEQQVALTLPAKGDWTVRLEHTPAAWEQQMRWVSLASGLLVVGGCFVRRRRRP